MNWSDDAARNRELWTKSNAEHTGASARGAWAAEEISWGVFNIPEADVRVLPEVDGKDVVELGCGTAYISAWLARRGARPVGVDITPAQLETARAMQREFGLDFPLIEADAAETGLTDGCADLVVSEYGASIWVAPYRWIPEAARLLRPGGELVFLCNSTLVVLCSPDGDVPAGEQLVRPQFGMHRFPNWDGVEFHLAHGDWIRLLRDNGFDLLDLLDLVELQAPVSAVSNEYYDYVTSDWARQWHAEEIWKARKR